MKRISRIACVLIGILLAVVPLSSCGGSAGEGEGEKLSIVATVFPGYDFARTIVDGIEGVQLKMLLKPGSETHSYEPTPQDIIAIKNCDIFIYVGGESDEWIKNILESVDASGIALLPMMDCVDLVEEEIVEGMEEIGEDDEEHGFEPEYDEHVWASPVNTIKISEKISEAVKARLTDENDKSICAQNAEAFRNELTELDESFRDVVAKGARQTIVFGDRFPFRYFADEYGLKYYAAFPGCSSETEASARTISFLIDKVNEEEIPVVFYPEMSNMKVARTICESTSAVPMQLNSCHNVTAEEFESGVTYLSLMGENVGVLETALN